MTKINKNRGNSNVSQKKSGNKDMKSSFKTNPVSRNVTELNRRVTTRLRANQMRPTSNGLIVRNAEKVYTVPGSTTAVTTFSTLLALNPCGSLFSWLSKIGTNYALYRWKKLRVCYVSVVPTSTLGNVQMAPFFDIIDAISWNTGGSSTLLSMLEHSTEGPVWGSVIRSESKGISSDIMCEVDVDRLHMRTPWFRCAPAAVSANYAEFNQAVAVEIGLLTNWSGTASQNVGDIWIEYEIEFSHPNYNSVGTNFTLSAYDSGMRMREHSTSPSIYASLLEECRLRDMLVDEESIPPPSSP